MPPSRHVDGNPATEVFGHMCVACHGLSVLVTAARLGIDLAAIEAVLLSHWHWDHSGALPVVIEAIVAARRASGRARSLLPAEPATDALAIDGASLEMHAEPHLVGGGLLLASGAIERATSYETGLAGHVSFHGDEVVDDEQIMDERFLAAEVRGRGVTVLSACSHAGVVNACLGARSHYPGSEVDLVLGGSHLAGVAMEPRISATVAELTERIDPLALAPGHCTGWRAKAALAEAFAPGRYAPSVVGSRYLLRASRE